MNNIEIEVLVRSKKWFDYLDQFKINDDISNICQDLFKEEPLKDLVKSFKIAALQFSLTNNRQIKEINQKSCGKNKATNILSFPNFSNKELVDQIDKKTNYILLGDIIISCEKVAQESRKQNKKFKNHLTHLILHGILHLFNFDHQNDDEAEIMENIEIKILKNLNINNPYN